MNRGRSGSCQELSSSDEEDSPRRPGSGGRPGAERLPGAGAASLLERCVAPQPATAREEGEGVFEIRDFTTASSFERIAHQLTLAAKKWAGVLKSSSCDDGGQLLRESFDHMDFKYEVIFQLMPLEPGGVPSAMTPSLAKAAAGERLGLQSFPSRAHRLQRWFGVSHFAIVSVRGQNIDPDSARTVLSALVLAAQGAAAQLPQPLACFVPVDGGRRRRYLGELVSCGRRTLYTTDSATSMQSNLEHVEGLLAFFGQKLGLGPGEAAEAPVTVGARFTYLADAFDRLTDEPGAARPEGAPPPKPTDIEMLDRDDREPVDSMQLHCLWPCFPQGSFADNATFSELEPPSAPYWKLRVLRRDDSPLPLCRQLRSLLEFRKEARSVRSAEHSMQPQLPKTALASLSWAIQESLESILLPTAAELQALVEQCLGCPVAGRPASGEVSGLRGSRRGTRLAKLAEVACSQRCFKAFVMLWCQVLARMRQHWDALVPPLPGEAPARARRVAARGVRAELFDSGCCLVQQKFEVLQQSIDVQLGGRLVQPGGPVPPGLKLQATGEALVAPLLLRPALLTEDMVVQQDMAAASITDPTERAELHGRELRSDVAAFKASNPRAQLVDFLAWRREVEGLSVEPFPQAWLESIWCEVPAQAAAEQQGTLFEPVREAEMALHYLESIDGTQLLLQIFQVQLRATLEELSPEGSAHLRVLRDRAEAAARSAFSGAGQSSPASSGDEADPSGAAAVGESAGFPADEPLQSALAACEALEAAARLLSSLRQKLPDVGATLLEELLTESEANVGTHAQRSTVAALFERSRVLAQGQLRQPLDGMGIFESLPMSKEFVLLLQPPEGAGAGTRRLYAEIRERYLRLAIARSFRLA